MVWPASLIVTDAGKAHEYSLPLNKRVLWVCGATSLVVADNPGNAPGRWTVAAKQDRRRNRRRGGGVLAEG